MKIAIFHDYFDKRGGGERLVINLARRLKADIYTGFIDKSKTFDTKGIKIHNFAVRKGPQLYRNIKISKKFAKIRLTGYDAYIFSGVWCISAAENHKPNFLYLHTPMRVLYDLKDKFLRESNLVTRVALKSFIKQWTPKDQRYMREFDIIGTNSEGVRNRVRKYYGKTLYNKSTAVYTGIDTKKYKYKKSGDFYLSASRLDPLKRIDMLIRVFKKNGRKLVIIGTGPDEKRLKELARGCSNIKFLGKVSDKRLRDLYSTCRATLAASLEEDLGIVGIEGNASGKPVVAIQEGGFLETVKEGKNGVFFKNENDLQRALDKLERTKWKYKYIRKTAKQFDIDVFAKKIEKHLTALL